jgi:hypothetical protein
MATPLLHNVIDGKVLESGVLRTGLAVSGLSHTWRASHYDIWLIAHGVWAKIIANWADFE